MHQQAIAHTAAVQNRVTAVAWCVLTGCSKCMHAAGTDCVHPTQVQRARSRLVVLHPALQVDNRVPGSSKPARAAEWRALTMQELGLGWRSRAASLAIPCTCPCVACMLPWP
jgi:hypothetical protein